MKIIVKICFGFLAAFFAAGLIHLYILKKSGQWMMFAECAPSAIAAPVVFLNASYYSAELYFLKLPKRTNGNYRTGISGRELEMIRSRSQMQGLLCSASISAAFWFPIFLRRKRKPAHERVSRIRLVERVADQEGSPN